MDLGSFCDMLTFDVSEGKCDILFSTQENKHELRSQGGFLALSQGCALTGSIPSRKLPQGFMVLESITACPKLRRQSSRTPCSCTRAVPPPATGRCLYFQ